MFVLRLSGQKPTAPVYWHIVSVVYTQCWGVGGQNTQSFYLIKGTWSLKKIHSLSCLNSLKSRVIRLWLRNVHSHLTLSSTQEGCTTESRFLQLDPHGLAIRACLHLHRAGDAEGTQHGLPCLHATWHGDPTRTRLRWQHVLWCLLKWERAQNIAEMSLKDIRALGYNDKCVKQLDYLQISKSVKLTGTPCFFSLNLTM